MSNDTPLILLIITKIFREICEWPQEGFLTLTKTDNEYYRLVSLTFAVSVSIPYFE